MNISRLPPVICLMGPTASGKTDLALQLADHFELDIISVDSTMVYRGMDIGSAKPSPDILARFPHQLIDIRDPIDTYSAADFRQDALLAIENSLQKKRTPLLVGGTMLYFKALQQGLSALPSANPEIREQLWQEGQQFGWPFLHQRLTALDPQAAMRIHPNDPQRIQRALEVCMLTGKPLSELQTGGAPPLPYTFINIGLISENRHLLHQRIANRLQQMFAMGFLAEVEKLFANPLLHAGLPALRAVGYRQLWQYLAGELSYETMQEKALTATRQLAKRQITWLRSWPAIQYFSSEEKELSSQVTKFLSSRLSGN